MRLGRRGANDLGLGRSQQREEYNGVHSEVDDAVIRRYYRSVSFIITRFSSLFITLSKTPDIPEKLRSLPNGDALSAPERFRAVFRIVAHAVYSISASQ